MGIRISERALTSDELAMLRRKRTPWLLSWLFGKSRKLAEQEISGGIGEELEFEVQRVWNASPCEPPCCPPHYLFQLSADDFLSIKLQDLEDDTPLAEIPRRSFKIVRSPLTKMILSWSASGDRVRIEPTDLGQNTKHGRGSLVPATSVLAECELFSMSDFGDELKKILGHRTP